MPAKTEILSQHLSQLGVQEGDVLMVHVSLRRLFLKAPDGAAILLSALERSVGKTGTLLMILGTESPMEWVNELPVHERAAALENTPGFEPNSAPALAEVGAFAEFFRQSPGTIVSSNPSGRFGARGALAEELLREAPWHDGYGPGSPLERAAKAGARILRLGANPETVTALHYSEYLAEVPNKRRTRWDYVINTPEGPRHVWVENLDDAEGIVDFDGDDYFAAIHHAWVADGRGTRQLIGSTWWELYNMAEYIDFGAKWMTKNLRAG